tara:strand:+ start:61 stop:270 length:210 start_codon:yes stop_codon:yes gene_type:complete
MTNKTGYKHISVRYGKNLIKEIRPQYRICIMRKGKILWSECIEIGTTLEQAVEHRNTKVYPMLGIEIND